MMNGGYDEGYRACPCFWGKAPGSLVLRLQEVIGGFADLNVLDAGCGEGKNAAFFAEQGANVRAVDISRIAMENAAKTWGALKKVQWEVGDVRTVPMLKEAYDIVIGYGLFHCLDNEQEIAELIQRLLDATKPGGYNVICVFNDRHQELMAHPGFAPTLLSHETYLRFYDQCWILYSSDSDLHESHPHNNIPHVHSMTRIILRKDGRI